MKKFKAVLEKITRENQSESPIEQEAIDTIMRNDIELNNDIYKQDPRLTDHLSSKRKPKHMLVENDKRVSELLKKLDKIRRKQEL